MPQQSQSSPRRKKNSPKKNSPQPKEKSNPKVPAPSSQSRGRSRAIPSRRSLSYQDPPTSKISAASKAAFKALKMNVPQHIEHSPDSDPDESSMSSDHFQEETSSPSTSPPESQPVTMQQAPPARPPSPDPSAPQLKKHKPNQPAEVPAKPSPPPPATKSPPTQANPPTLRLTGIPPQILSNPPNLLKRLKQEMPNIEFSNLKLTNNGLLYVCPDFPTFNRITKYHKQAFDQNLNITPLGHPQQTPPPPNPATMIVIRSVPIFIDLAQIESSLTEQNIPFNRITRISSAATKQPTTFVKVSILNETIADKLLNEGITLFEFLKFKCEKAHIPQTATQCFNCQLFGHTQTNCKAPPKCHKCAGPHSSKTCTQTTDPKCANCGGPHMASSRFCPTYRLAAKNEAASSTPNPTLAPHQRPTPPPLMSIRTAAWPRPASSPHHPPPPPPPPSQTIPPPPPPTPPLQPSPQTASILSKEFTERLCVALVQTSTLLAMHFSKTISLTPTQISENISVILQDTVNSTLPVTQIQQILTSPALLGPLPNAHG